MPPIVPAAAYPGWNSRRYWPNDRYDPRYESRFDTRYNPNRKKTIENLLSFPFKNTRISVGIAKPYPVRPVYNDYRTIRLDEKVDAKGYRYV